MLAVNFEKRVLEGIPEFPGRRFIPVLDSKASIDDLIQMLQDIKSKYEVVSVFIAGDAIVGSCADVGDYTALCVEVK